MLSTKIGEMKVELARFMRETLQLVALDDYPAQVFLMESGDAGVDWQVAVDALYRCVESDLVKLYPCGDGMGQLSRVEYFERMSRSDPDANGTDNWLYREFLKIAEFRSEMVPSSKFLVFEFRIDCALSRQ